MKKPLYVTTEQALMNVPLPEETVSYKPVSHQELIEMTREAIRMNDLTIQSVHYESAKDGQVANARYVIEDIRDDEMSLMIGWQNSYNKQVTLKFAIGAQIFICDNGCVTGDFGSFKRKHTGEVQSFTPAAIASYIAGARETFFNLSAERDAMKNVKITDRQAGEILGRLFYEKNAIVSTQLNNIAREMSNPRYRYGDIDSLWQLYQVVTFALKTSHPSEWMDNHILTHEVFVETLHELSDIEVPFMETFVDDVPSNQLELFEEDES